MSNNSLITSVTHSNADVIAGKQKPYWVEIQLVDEQHLPVENMPWIAESSHPVSGSVDEFTYSGQSDAEGLIRIDMRHGLELKLTLDGNQLATEMETRSLRVGRDAIEDSLVRPKAEQNGHIWHYAVIGELCRTLPSIQLREGEIWPPFHFPDKKIMKGLTLYSNQLQRRHILEICPFRAWELVLHHQKEYSLANALNLGGNACLAYSDDNMLDKVSIIRFFVRQCQDLSKLPIFYKGNDSYNALVCDVPYSKRYYPPVFMDTSLDTSATKADGDTQLYYVYNTDKVIVAWRGTASLYNVGTDLAFRPVSSESCDIDKTQCTTLLSAGKIHTGFWSGYNRVNIKFPTDILKLIRLSGPRDLYICGHSLGGALALIHAVSLKDSTPLLYTYGMPRTFTRDAVMQLSEITHFRHVNDNDPVPAVPPEANMDNELFKLWGWFGGTLGFFWALGQIMAAQMVAWGDCFWHHGNTVAFLTASQSREWKECKIDVPIQAGCITIRKSLPIKAKLYLVPALAEQEMQQAGQKQKEFKASLTQADLTAFFPKGSNPERGINLNFFDHFMTSYMPYMYNKLLELIDNAEIVEKSTFTEHLHNVNLFKEQMGKNKDNIPEKELSRNKLFLDVEGLLDVSLSPTLSVPYGRDTLLRFAKYSEDVIENA